MASDKLEEFARWLVSLDEPGSEERRTITLTKIIDRARDALAAGTRRKITVELTEAQIEALITACKVTAASVAQPQAGRGPQRTAPYRALLSARDVLENARPIRMPDLSRPSFTLTDEMTEQDECTHVYANGVCRCTALQPLEGDSDGER